MEKIQKLNSSNNTPGKNVNILINENLNFNFSLEIDEIDMLHTEHIPVPQEVSDHSAEILQAFSEKNIQNLQDTTQPNKNQIASGREYGGINQQTPTKPSTSNNDVIANAYFQLP
ncbi:hypothetical protein QE152_g3553 [Popillia japonica]|uniref:Uncharacterized protein n=1 Tax=Popillia japonica TaxID=7064 RepID=A0AAW1N490_POPJA